MSPVYFDAMEAPASRPVMTDSNESKPSTNQAMNKLIRDRARRGTVKPEPGETMSDAIRRAAGRVPRDEGHHDDAA